jgi:cell division transport system ATP-binding protein
MIQFRDVAVCYDPSQRYPVNALEGVNLLIEPGEWVFVVGPSGAGKSTLLRLVYHGAQATKGQITVDGQDITTLAPRDIPFLRRKIGVIFQDFQLLGQKTVWENVAFALQVIGAPQKSLVKEVPRALETVGLQNKANARPHELSGGEQQRVAIARAIVNDPLILIADEPTGNLDPRTAEDIAIVLKRINERGTTILMATHDRHLVDNMHKRVVRIADSRVVSDEADGVYHPEDDDPRSGSRTYAGLHLDDSPFNADNSNAAAEPDIYEAATEELPEPFESPKVAPSDEPLEQEEEELPLRRILSEADAPSPPIAPQAPRPDMRPSAARPLAPSSPPPRRLVSEEEASLQDEPAYLRQARQSQAPLGSPENPIVQLDRVGEGRE